MKEILKQWNRLSLVQQIIIGLVIGIILALVVPKATGIGILGNLFVGALKAVAPVLVLLLVMSAIAQHKSGQQTNMKSIIGLYLIGTFLAGCVAVVGSFIFKLKLVLPDMPETENVPPKDITEVVTTLLNNLVKNPVDSLMNGNYIGILAWALLLGVALRIASDTTKTLVSDFSDAISQLVRWVIKFAPLGVMGLVFTAVSENGLKIFKVYGKIIILLVGVMLFDALIINPIIVFIKTRQNPYPLVLKCLKDSGITAFFTRSSAANIPVNMRLCDELGLDKDTYSISIPLGATINMGGAAVTISVLTLATAHTMGISVDLPTAIILCLLSAVSACGASGVAGGSLLLIPLACSLFGISNDIAMQVVGVGFIIGVIQDSCETALNSSTDVLFTATADIANKKKQKSKA